MEGSAEIDALVKSAYNMKMMTKQGENNLDNMLSKAHRVAAQISSMYKYEKFLSDVQSLTVNGNRRKTILNDLQRENKQIMALQDENRQLRETTEEYLSTMREILESHAELETSIHLQQKTNEVDDIDNIIYEMANTNLEANLKKKAQNLQGIMDELEQQRREEKNDLMLAVQNNKNYKELFNLASFSSPAAGNVLKAAMSAIVAEMEKGMENEEKENEEDVEVKMEKSEDRDEQEENDDDLNKTIIRQA